MHGYEFYKIPPASPVRNTQYALEGSYITACPRGNCDKPGGFLEFGRVSLCCCEFYKPAGAGSWPFRRQGARLSRMIEIPDGDFAAYIFDCDGTLGDTMPLHYTAWCAALREQNCEFPEAFFYELGGVPTERIVEILNERHGYRMAVKETAAYKEQLYLKGIGEIGPIEPVVEIVRRVHGRLPLAVASGGHRHVVTKTLAALGILEMFEAVICAEDYRQGKPNPEPFLTAAARLGWNRRDAWCSRIPERESKPPPRPACNGCWCPRRTGPGWRRSRPLLPGSREMQVREDE